jgi:preprotein translocase subunit SecA
VVNAGGLCVIGTERHESRRIDNQLRGRSGRQGDPGESKFFVSLQDDLMRIFGGESVSRVMDRFGLDENVPLEAGIVSKSIENAQKRVEGFNFDRRKQLVEMDDIMNTHREVVYELRRRILELENGNESHKEWLIGKLSQFSDLDYDTWDQKEKDFGKETWFQIVSGFGCPVIDYLWMSHLVDMDQVRDGIGLRGYAQRDPMVEYKREGHERFEILVSKVYSMMGERLSSVSKDVSLKDRVSDQQQKLTYHQSELETGVSVEGQEIQERKVIDQNSGRELKVEKIESGKEKVGRNDPCPCGSGKKYKNCHGRNI